MTASIFTLRQTVLTSLLTGCGLLGMASEASAPQPAVNAPTKDSTAPALFTQADSLTMRQTEKKLFALQRLHVGGYGEVAMSRNFYSDNYLRYTDPTRYKGGSHGRFDLPHVVIYLGYDFGKGWSFSSEIEFEHGGTESAIEIETEEA